jgi:hypothetical protein
MVASLGKNLDYLTCVGRFEVMKFQSDISTGMPSSKEKEKLQFEEYITQFSYVKLSMHPFVIFHTAKCYFIAVVIHLTLLPTCQLLLGPSPRPLPSL